MIDILQADPCLDPGGQIVPHQFVVRESMPDATVQGGLDRRCQSRQFAFAAPARIGHAAERFRNDRIRADPGAEDFRGDPGHRGALLFRGAFACHGRGRADADRRMLRVADPRLESAHQHRHIRALAPAVGVQLIEHDEPQAAAILDDLPVQIVLPRHEQFEHHEVGKQNVRRVVPDALAFVGAFLSGVSREGRRIRAPCAEIAPQLFCLAVGKGIHRIDDDGAGARGTARFPGLDRGVDDRNEETQRLPRAGSSRHGVTLIVQGIADCLLLVLAEPQRSIPAAPGGREVPKYLGAFGFQIAGVDEILYRAAVGIVRVELNQRLGPESPGRVQFIDLRIQLRRADICKRACEGLVVIDDGFIEIEDVHHQPPPGEVRASWLGAKICRSSGRHTAGPAASPALGISAFGRTSFHDILA